MTKDPDSGLYTPSDPQFFPKPPSDRRNDESLRQSLRHKARSNLYFLCKGILGYDKLVPHAHGALCKFLASEEVLGKVHRRMIQMPRDHFKTTIATISHTIQLILQEPEVRILLVAQSSRNAERFLKEIKNHFQRNEKLKWLFPELIPEDFSKVTWNRQEMEVQRTGLYREPTVDTIGSRGAVESRHYDWIKGDDIIGEKEKESDAEMDKTIEWASGLESLLIEPTPTETQAGSHIDFIGTRWKNSDVYAYLEDFYGHDEEPTEIGPFAFRKGEIAIFRRGARKQDGSGDPIFPELITKEFLDRLQQKNPERYAAQYANNPKQSGLNTFNEDWLRYWKEHEREGTLVLPRHMYETRAEPEIIPRYSLDVIALYDPASGEGDSRQAIMVTGAHRRQGMLDIILLETHIGFYSVTDAVELIFDIHERYASSLRFFSIEEYGFQNTIKYWMREKANREMLPMPPIRKFPPKGVSRAKKAKDKRIQGLQPLFSAGQVWIQEGMSAFLDEYLYYPHSKFRDALDALAQGVEWWGTSWSQKHQDEMREREQRLLDSFDRTGYGLKEGAMAAHEKRRREEPSPRLRVMG